MKVFRAVNEKQVKPLSPAHHALIHIESFSEAAQRTQACATLSIGSFYCSSWFRFNLPICRGITLSFTNVFFVTKEGPKKKISWHTRVNFGPPAQNTPPPKPPFLTSHTNKKGVNLLRIQAAICLHVSHAKYCNTWRATGQKPVCPRSCTDHLFSAQIQPKSLPKHFFPIIMQLMLNAMRKLQIWNQLLLICLNTPPRPTWGHSVHFMTRHPDPLL